MGTQFYRVSLVLTNGNKLELANGNNFDAITNLYNLMSVLLDTDVINKSMVKEISLDKI